MVETIHVTVSNPDTTPKAIVLQESAPPVAITVGIQGPEGVSGAGGSSHFHSQSVASDLWVINHNLGHRPLIELYTIGGVGMDGTIVHIDNNQIQVQFASPTTGFASLI